MMLLPSVRQQVRDVSVRWWHRVRRVIKWPLIVTLGLIIFYGLWPYATLWHLNNALIQGDRDEAIRLVDLEAIRNQLARRLNKDRNSAIDYLSDPFVEWLDSGIRRSGRSALNELVTLDWLREQWMARSAPGLGLLAAISYGTFDSPKDFRVHIGHAGQQPLTARLHLSATGWRVEVLYY